jgi:8-oxo-dGTP pyrophosphatase MutT (NUDIX family)
MSNLKEYGDLIYSFFNGNGKKYYITLEEAKEKKIPGSEYEDKIYKDFIDYAIKYSKSHKNKKYIIEGVWIFCNDESGKSFFEPEYFKDYAFYIKGTSAIKSKYRAAIRDSKDSSNKFDQIRSFSKNFFIKNWKWYKLDEKRINRFRDYFKNKPETVLSESYIEEASTGLFKKIQKDPEIIETYGFVSSDNIYNENIKIKGFNKWLRGRSELLIIDKDKVYLKKDNKGYSIPGGGWEKDEDHNLSAIRETNEEARIKVKNVSYVGSYASFFEPKDWVKERISEENWWYGEYTELYIGEYDGEFKGHVDKIDQDKKMESGKFYDIKSVYKDLISVHQEALDNIINESYLEESIKVSKEEIFKNANIIRDKVKEFIKDKKYKYISVIYKDRIGGLTGFMYKNIYLIDLLRFSEDKYCKDKSEGNDSIYRSRAAHDEARKYFNTIKNEVLKFMKNIPEFKIFENKLILSYSPNTNHGYDSINYNLAIKKSNIINEGGYIMDSKVSEAMNALMTGYIPGAIDNPNNTYIVNYMQNNVFSDEDPNEDCIGVSDSPLFTNLIVRDKDNVLKKVDESFLKDKTYNVYIVEKSIEEVSKLLAPYMNKEVEFGFLYETMTGKKLYTKDQVGLEGVLIPVMDYYEYMKEFKEICDNYFSAKDKRPVEINEVTCIPKEVRHFSKSGLMQTEKVYTLNEYINSKPSKVLECLDLSFKLI